MNPILRSMLHWLLCLALVWLSNSAGAVAPTSKPARPNIIIILADDLGWGDLGCYGNKKYPTPNLDRMAAEGVRSTQFYVPCPYCAPTRAALLTGRYQFRSGVTRNPAPDAGIDDVGLPDKELTLAELLRSAGYRTAMIGKWHLGHKPEFYPVRHGFDEYLGILYSNDMRPVQLVQGETVVEYPVVQATLTKRYTERALAFLQQYRRAPFFLYFAHAMPHKPLAASEAFYKKSSGGLYGDAMEELDWSVGQILQKLKELRLEEKTLVMFASDNGPYFGGSTGGLRGMKGNTWEGGIRVPCIARWPGQIPAGQVSDAPGIIMDLFATSLVAAGTPIPQDRPIDGRNLLGCWKGETNSPHTALFAMGGNQLRSVRSGKWKLHVTSPGNIKTAKPGEPWIDKRAPDGVTLLAPYEQAHPSQYPGVLTGDETKPLSLFDLETDPAEQHDVAAAYPEVVKKLETLFNAMAEEAQSTSEPERKEKRPRKNLNERPPGKSNL